MASICLLEIFVNFINNNYLVSRLANLDQSAIPFISVFTSAEKDNYFQQEPQSVFHMDEIWPGHLSQGY